MFINLFLNLKESKIPVSLREFLTFLEAVSLGLSDYKIENFYYLARLSLIKDERHIDKFDRVFSTTFNGLDAITLEDLVGSAKIPNDWLAKLAEKMLSEEEMRQINSLGGFDKLMETLRKRLNDQEKRHQGGNKWIGTAGTSPFGAYGYNPEGIRIGQAESRHRKAIKVWDKRDFKDLDDHTELGTRGMKVSLKRLRHWAREGAEEELDLDHTIHSTAKNGYLDIKTRQEKRNAVKVLIFFDIGGSMDLHVKKIEELFSAAKSSFKNMEYFYFHNCLYEGVWRNNYRRWTDQIPTHEIIRTYGHDYKCIFVGDAAMSPYEIEIAGGANEHYNSESGRVWLERAITQWPKNVWINPVIKEYWHYTQSTLIIDEIFEKRMVPLTIKGLETGMKILVQ
jgi:hypothetical protein